MLHYTQTHFYITICICMYAIHKQPYGIPTLHCKVCLHIFQSKEALGVKQLPFSLSLTGQYSKYSQQNKALGVL